MARYSKCVIKTRGVLPNMGYIYRYVRSLRKGVFSCFGHKQGIDFGHFGYKYRVWCLDKTGMILRRSYISIVINTEPSTKAVHIKLIEFLVRS